MKKNKKEMTIGVFFGSRNPEHEVSIITAQLIISELKKLQYDVVPVYIDRRGRWFSDVQLGSLKFFTDANFESALDGFGECSIRFDVARQKIVLKGGKIFSKNMEIDLVFPAFHGMNGEDGTMQGVFELSGVPYVGCGVTSSALTMDKILTKQLYLSEGIETTPFMSVMVHKWRFQKKVILAEVEKLHWPVFVKPARLGSSIGITKVKSREDLDNALEVAFHYDSRVIVEESVENLMDITCAVLGNEEPLPSLVQESVFSGDHFSYETKYLEDGGAQLGNAQESIVIPARIDDTITQEVRDLAVRIYTLFDCSGIARIDFLYDKEKKKVFANEINTLPGTLYHHLWKASGVSMPDLLEKLIQLALERHEDKRGITSAFKSNILQYANSIKLKMT